MTPAERKLLELLRPHVTAEGLAILDLLEDTRRGPKPDPEVRRLAAEAMKLYRKGNTSRKAVAWEVTKDETMQARVLNYLNANWAKLQDFGEN